MSDKRVFLSSTSKDLTEYREAAYRAIERLDGYHCVRMEDFGARNWRADAFCRAKVGECDVLVGIVGHCHGSCPPDSDQSYTEREYDAAVDTGVPRLMFLAPEDFPLPAKLIEPDEQRRRQAAFRDRVSGDCIRATFSSPDDLGALVAEAIHNWAREAAAIRARPEATRAEGVIPVPPQPYFAQYYPLQENFTGRVKQRQMLSAWLAGDERPLLALTAIGGMGKSALAWAWLQRDVLGLPLPGQAHDPPDVAGACRVPETARPEGVLWWSFYEREARFATFLDGALTYASGGSVDPRAIPSDYEKAGALVNLLRERRLLLVLDGFERELRAYASISAAYQGDTVVEEPHADFRACTDPHAATFLRSLAAGALQSRVILTSRLPPQCLDGLPACRREELTALDPDEAVAFFWAQGVRGTRAEIEAACQPYGYLPLALRLLAGVIVRDKRKPGDISVAGRYPVLPELKGKEQHHILQVAYDALDEQKRALLSCIAAFRSAMDYEALAVLNPYKSEEEFDAALDELMDRGLLFFDRERGRYDLHPIVRQHAYDRLTDRKGVHTRLRDYFAAVPAPDPSAVQTLDDLAPVIELYHHTAGAGRYDEACQLFSDRLSNLLYFRFGAYQSCIELLRALFPDGERRPPRVRTKRNQSWVANDLASSYSLSGQPRRAVDLSRMAMELDEAEADKANVAIDLENLAYDQLKLGDLAAAEANLRRAIDLCRESGDDSYEAIGHRHMGLVLAYRGAFGEAAAELDAAQRSFSKLREPQSECGVWALRAERALLMGEAETALEAARRSRALADEVARTRYPHERDFISAEWLLGASLVALASEQPRRRGTLLSEAEPHLTEALTRCRCINLVDHEPDILLAWARWHQAKGNVQQATEDAKEALEIADRCEYRLKQAEVHNFLARLALEGGDRKGAAEHATAAYERAWCDGPPHCYKPALEEAERLLDELGVPPPRVKAKGSP
jgi:tetratricopeptide (TPR) repeat protein